MPESEKQELEVWGQGDAYEPFIGRWSRPVAREFLKWLGVRNGKRWLDVGSGTGALTEMILQGHAPEQVVGVDLSEGFVAHARAHVNDARASFHVGDAQELNAERGSFDAVVSGLVLNFVPSPERMLTEMTRACRLSGCVALYVWDYAGEMQFLRHFWDAAIEIDPTARTVDEAARFPLASALALWNLFLDAGLNDVMTRAIDVPTRFANFDDLWSPFLTGLAPAQHYVKSLSEEKRAALRDKLRERLTAGPDGSIDLMARAWAVKGTR